MRIITDTITVLKQQFYLYSVFLKFYKTNKVKSNGGILLVSHLWYLEMERLLTTPRYHGTRVINITHIVFFKPCYVFQLL